MVVSRNSLRVLREVNVVHPLDTWRRMVNETDWDRVLLQAHAHRLAMEESGTRPADIGLRGEDVKCALLVDTDGTTWQRHVREEH